MTDDVTRVDFSEHPLRRLVGDERVPADSVIVATGATARQLGLESERTLQGRGVSYCAVCDAAFFRDKEIVVVGGGDSAMEEAIFLTKFATKVTLVHRRDEFRASQIMLDRARDNEKIEFVTPYVVDEVLGENGQTSAVRLRDLDTGETRELPADGLFVAIGHDPNTTLFLDQLDHDEDGYLVTKPGSTATNSRASSPPATSRTTSTARRSPPPAPAAWPRSTPSAGSRRARATRLPRCAAAARSSLRASYPRRVAEWIDLLDPDARRAPRGARRGAPRPRARAAARAARHDDEPRPRLESHGDYVFGVLLVPSAIREEDRVFYQEIDLVATRERLVTVRKTPERGHPFDPRRRRSRRSASDDDAPAMIVYLLVDEIAEGFLDLVDAI